MYNPDAKIRALEDRIKDLEAALDMRKALITPTKGYGKYYIGAGDELEVRVPSTGYVIRLLAHSNCVLEMLQ